MNILLAYNLKYIFISERTYFLAYQVAKSIGRSKDFEDLNQWDIPHDLQTKFQVILRSITRFTERVFLKCSFVGEEMCHDIQFTDTRPSEQATNNDRSCCRSWTFQKTSRQIFANGWRDILMPHTSSSWIRWETAYTRTLKATAHFWITLEGIAVHFKSSSSRRGGTHHFASSIY